MITRTSSFARSATFVALAALSGACAAGDAAPASDPNKDQGGSAGSTNSGKDPEPRGVGGQGREGAQGGSLGRGGLAGQTETVNGHAGGNSGGPAGVAHQGGSTSAGGSSLAHSGGGTGGGGRSQHTGGQSGTGGQHTGGQPGTGGSTASGGNTGTGTSGSCSTPEEEKFSFFLISNKAIQRESGNEVGFGGNLGGLQGADAICQRVAEYVSPCQKNKVWHAFLSTSKVDAIDRIGKGPWYDRMGRLLANNLTDLVQDRPSGADPAIKNDFPNEDGVPNHTPQGTQQVDNHEILTGSGLDGRLYKQTDTGTGGSGIPFGSFGDTACGNGETWTVEKATCSDWTSSKEEGCPRVGHSWPRQGSGTNWISVWNEGGCAPGGNLTDQAAGGGLDGTRRVGSAGGYGGFYCFAVTSN